MYFRIQTNGLLVDGVLVLQERNLYLVRNEAIFGGERNLLKSAPYGNTVDAVSTESRAPGIYSLTGNDDPASTSGNSHSDLQSLNGNGSTRSCREIVKREYENNLIGCHFLENSEEVSFSMPRRDPQDFWP
ncbi:unnamed protein product [Cylicostephanus goldi]|uniref:Uncharacterized protein n=1 Tax=Cylicostephanus goldi TaxID=71465 RepID=A0A3P6THE0_CYLGO|nr:unnamed protein product [Cylicostephanus goldi]